VTGKTMATKNLGEHIGDLDSQCVLVCLAAIAELPAAAFRDSVRSQADAFVAALGPLPDMVSFEELQARQAQHDLARRGHHDLFLARYLHLDVFRNTRILLLSVAPGEDSH
jgi:predicted exporter